MEHEYNDRMLLVHSSESAAPLTMFATGQKVPESGIYRVIHKEHRLPHEVTLLRDQEFPRCAKCQSNVKFEVVALAPQMQRAGQIVVYELPELDPGFEPTAA